MSSGTASLIGFRPEVRTSYSKPSMVAGQIVDGEWRPIEYQNRVSSEGVPDGYFDKKLSENGLMGRTQAETIRWWFLSIAESERALGALCLETRLQEYKLTTTYKVEPLDAKFGLDSRGRALVESTETEE